MDKQTQQIIEENKRQRSRLQANMARLQQRVAAHGKIVEEQIQLVRELENKEGHDV